MNDGMTATGEGFRSGSVQRLDADQARLVDILQAAAGRPVSFEELRSRGVENPAVLAYELEIVGVRVTRLHRTQSGKQALCLEAEPQPILREPVAPGMRSDSPAHDLPANQARPPSASRWIGGALKRTRRGCVRSARACRTHLSQQLRAKPARRLVAGVVALVALIVVAMGAVSSLRGSARQTLGDVGMVGVRAPARGSSATAAARGHSRKRSLATADSTAHGTGQRALSPVAERDQKSARARTGLHERLRIKTTRSGVEREPASARRRPTSGDAQRAPTPSLQKGSHATPAPPGVALEGAKRGGTPGPARAPSSSGSRSSNKAAARAIPRARRRTAGDEATAGGRQAPTGDGTAGGHS